MYVPSRRQACLPPAFWRNNSTAAIVSPRWMAINSVVQGSAADMIKVAMINVYNALQKENFKTKMLLQVHDELVFDVYKPELEIVKPIIEYHMKHALKLNVPVEVGMGVGENWLEAH